MGKLFQDSGGDLNSRCNEAWQICRILEECVDQMEPKERNFIEQMTDADFVSPKQIFWLRDIKEKYL